MIYRVTTNFKISVIFTKYILIGIIINTIELEAKRMGIFRRILTIEYESLLQKIENLLYEKDLPIMKGYSVETLHDAVLRSKEDIQNGNIRTQEQLRTKHPRV